MDLIQFSFKCIDLATLFGDLAVLGDFLQKEYAALKGMTANLNGSIKILPSSLMALRLTLLTLFAAALILSLHFLKKEGVDEFVLVGDMIIFKIY